MNNNYNGFWKFIKFLDDEGFLKYVIVIGSWAEYIYQQADLLSGYKANLRTLDVDFLVKNKLIPKEKMNLQKEAKEKGYIVHQDVILNTSKIYMIEDNLEIEFLIDQKGSGIKPIIETNIGVNAQALRNLAILSDNIVNVRILDYNISVPVPEAYILHKMLINRERGNKAQKDIEGILNLFPYIDKIKFFELYNTLKLKSKPKLQ